MQQKLLSFITSKKFFYGTLIFFVFQAAWIALSGRFPMAFDEDYHLGIIRLYAHHLSPFWSTQPAHADLYGGVFRDPSYLYHYLMSFPYRLVSLFTNSQTAQVIFLRFINIALFSASLPLYRRLLRRVGLSAATTNCLVVLFVLIPIAPLLAAQINYDNLLLPLVALALLLCIRFYDELLAYKRINIVTLASLIIVCLLTSLVKSAFLPFFVVIALFLAVATYRVYGFSRKLWLSLGFGLSLISRRTRWLWLILFFISLGMFVERYGINIIRYHSIDPDCSQVLEVNRCEAYGPWARDNYLAQQNSHELTGPLGYSFTWAGAMWVRLFFAVDGPTTQFQTRGPLPVPAITAVILFTSGLVLTAALFIKHGTKWFLSGPLLLYVSTGLFYIIILWAQDYEAYVRTGQPVAINGRYLLPVMLLLLAPLALAFQRLLSARLKVYVATIAILGMLYGGGFLTYVLRSSDSWYWDSPAVQHMNRALQKTFTPIVPGSNDKTKFLFLT